ncbi:UNVERIFIED_CONTAM: hypothetical protein Sradi_3787800 [Sesamum radiatum]|uniref:Uncharacterized protein n=1 Tax=Sesamum radiatum TaxID=300843 RepID=A0AAW2PZX7_SESRA
MRARSNSLVGGHAHQKVQKDNTDKEAFSKLGDVQQYARQQGKMLTRRGRKTIYWLKPVLFNYEQTQSCKVFSMANQDISHLKRVSQEFRA